MIKIQYRLNTLSSLISSPRASLAFYKILNQFSDSQIRGEDNARPPENLKVIYPFYQYGTYEAYHPTGATYYLPGSSVKGALRLGETAPANLFVDDIPVARDKIVLRNLQKVQYIEEPEKTVLGAFFENVGVEMVRAGTELTGEAYLDSAEELRALIAEANKSAKIKMGHMVDRLYELIGRLEEADKAKLKETLCAVKKNLSDSMTHDDVLLLGGFKGLLHSIERDPALVENKGAIFLDMETRLPHGIVQMTLHAPQT